MHEHKFDSKAKVYSKSRPDYPESLFWYLLAEGIVNKEKIAADIGSGTGIFTKDLSSFVKNVFAVEPNDDMRKNAEDDYKSFLNIISVNGTAEDTSLPDKSVDLITVAQAFHWFDRTAFKTECQRILKANGKIVLVWNDRDVSNQVIQDNYAVNKKYCPDFKGSSNGFDFSKESFSDFFKGEIDVVEFDNSLVYDKETFTKRNLSSSYAPKETDLSFNEYVSAIEKVFEKHNVNGTVRYPYITRCYIGTI